MPMVSEPAPPSRSTDQATPGVLIEDVVLLVAGAAAARQARRLVGELLESWTGGPELTDTAVLLTSELVTNSYIHGRSAARLRVEADDQRVVVEVSDDNSRHPQPQPVDDDALDGRGLYIVDLLATRWGVADHELGKQVWFQLDI